MGLRRPSIRGGAPVTRSDSATGRTARCAAATGAIRRPMGSYRTVRARSRFQPEPVKGSRFVATVGPAADEADALALVDEVSAQWPDASHHCWAFRLRDGRSRCTDAGEPGGSAGRPILAQIDGHDLADVVVVVSRWFGGTKLGVGGLIRAYGGAAGMALDRAEIDEVPDLSPLRVEHDYGDTSSVDAVVAAEGLQRHDVDYGPVVAFVLDVPTDDLQRVREALRDRTAGRIRFPEDPDGQAG